MFKDRDCLGPLPSCLREGVDSVLLDHDVSDILNIGESEMTQTTSRVGKRGTIVVPAALRKQYGLEEGALVIAEEREDGILLRPAVAFPVEVYTRERRAEFLLNNAVDSDDYRGAVAEVLKLGLDPDAIPHSPPGE